MSVLEEVSTITSKGQTTVPKSVRRILGVDHGGRIAFRAQGDQVTVHRADEGREDPVVGRFLDFLSKDIERHPERVKPLSPSFAARLNALTKRRKIDLGEPIEGPVDL
jgi:antitoxin PrlF